MAVWAMGKCLCGREISIRAEDGGRVDHVSKSIVSADLCSDVLVLRVEPGMKHKHCQGAKRPALIVQAYTKLYHVHQATNGSMLILRLLIIGYTCMLHMSKFSFSIFSAIRRSHPEHMS